MKTYVLIVSERFPKNHPRAGESTGFVEKIKSGQKIHTIRQNPDLWKKRVDQINKGEAYLSVRVWTGKPYASKQKEVKRFCKLGFQETWKWVLMESSIVDEVADNDGLSVRDFKFWFKLVAPYERVGIIHFTDFRYSKNNTYEKSLKNLFNSLHF